MKQENLPMFGRIISSVPYSSMRYVIIETRRGIPCANRMFLRRAALVSHISFLFYQITEFKSNVYGHCRQPEEKGKKEVLDEVSKNPTEFSSKNIYIMLQIKAVVNSSKKEAKKDIDQEANFQFTIKICSQILF